VYTTHVVNIDFLIIKLTVYYLFIIILGVN